MISTTEFRHFHFCILETLSLSLARKACPIALWILTGLGECVDMQSRAKGQVRTGERIEKCRGAAVQMMDRTGVFEEGGGESFAFYSHLDEKRVGVRRRQIYDLIRCDGWMFPAVHDRFLLLFIPPFWYSHKRKKTAKTATVKNVIYSGIIRGEMLLQTLAELPAEANMSKVWAFISLMSYILCFRDI